MYRLEKANLDSTWDQFVLNSPNGTIFSYSSYLNSINGNCVGYYCYRNQEKRAALTIIESPDHSASITHEFVIYNGILYSPAQNKQNLYQIRYEHYEMAMFISTELLKLYNEVNLALHPSIVDIRPFLWVNYGTDASKYAVDVRYTSYLSLKKSQNDPNFEEDELFIDMSSSRRQEVRYAKKNYVETIEEIDSRKFAEFYVRTMLRQKISVSNDVKDEMKLLLDKLMEENIGKMYVAYTKEKEPGSMAFWCWDNKRAYYLFGANDPELRHTHTGSAVIWDSINILRSVGIKEIDFEGINSPKRGWFKLSFGGSIVPYYQLNWAI